MDRESFFNAIKSVREDMINGYYDRSSLKLDRVVEIAMGKSCDACTEEKVEQDLEKDVIRVIKRIEAAKKDEKLKTKAAELIETIKKSLED